MRTKQINFRLRVELVERLEALAQAQDRDRTYFIHKAVEEYLENQGAPKTSKPKAKNIIPSVNSAVGDQASDAVIDYLNKIASTNYQHSEASRKDIRARLKDGFPFDSFKTVVDKKCAEWLGTEMAKYLRPQTLFNESKFEGYLNQIVTPGKAAQRDSEMDDWINGVEHNRGGEVIDHEPF